MDKRLLVSSVLEIVSKKHLVAEDLSEINVVVKSPTYMNVMALKNVIEAITRKKYYIDWLVVENGDVWITFKEVGE